MQKDSETEKAIVFITQSYTALQRITGVDRTRWSRLFRGKENPSYDALRDWAVKAGVSLPDIVFAFEKRRESKVSQKRKDQVNPPE